MAKLLIGALALAVAVVLAVVIAVRRRQRLREVFRQEGDRLVVAAKALALVILLVAFAVLMLVNNR